MKAIMEKNAQEVFLMKSFRPVRTAVIGCGMISRRYLDN